MGQTARQVIPDFLLSTDPWLPSTENLPETNITTTQFEAGQCYSDDQITEYLLQSGETQVMDLDKKGVVNVRQNTPFGPQVVPRRFNNEYNLTADADSWTIIEEKPNGDNCIVLQGTDLDYVSIDNRYFTQINDSPTPATSERERALNTMQERFGETVFFLNRNNIFLFFHRKHQYIYYILPFCKHIYYKYMYFPFL